MISQDFLEVMQGRQQQLPLRLAIGIGVGVVLGPVLGWAEVLIWYLVWSTFQGLEALWTRRARRNLSTVRPAEGLAIICIANTIFIGVGLAVAAGGGGSWMTLCGVLLMAGALLNAGASSGVSTALFIASAGPASVSILAILIVAWRSGASVVETTALAGTTALLLFAVYVMRQVSVQALRSTKAASASKGEFLANLSHEIRTPLNGVLGMAQAMAADDLPAAQRERLEVLRRSGEALLELLNDVLDLSKVEAGKLEIEIRDVDLAQMARDLARTFDEAARGKGVAVAFEVTPDLEGLWRGDPTRIRQILTNLLSNAVKFTAEGTVRVTMTETAGQIVFAVRDSGVGIAQDRLEQVFDKYAQASASTARQFGGTGLGLAICRDLAALMGGTVDAESQLGIGSTFRLSLPLERSAVEAAPAAEEAGMEIDLGGLRVLAAEDHETNQLVLQVLLAQVGVEVTIVGDGRAAVDAWRAGEWDVILIDVQMPVLDGPSAVREIRAEEAARGRAPTPILALTANAMRHQIEEYLACGMDGFVAKPLEFSKLIEALAQVLAKRPAVADQRMIA